jgi:predicted MFS family arabinose efflux permease
MYSSITLNRPAITVLGVSAFFYVTAENIPVGLLPQMAHGLGVSEATVGLLLTSYAVVAGLSTIPLTALSMRVPRHLVIATTLVIFTVSQGIATFAPTFLTLALARLVCALAHGVFWSVLAPVAARLAPAGQAGQATALVFVGNSLAIVLGVPLSTALGQWLGWRVALGAMAVGGVISLLALVKVLPKLPALPHDLGTRTGEQLRAAVRIIRNREVALLCLITTVLVIGHFASYAYLAPLVRRDGGLEGLGLSALLLGAGAAGLLTNLAIGRHVDRRPGVLMIGALAVIAVSVALLAPVLGPVPTWICALLWGGAFAATPACLQATVLRVAPRARDAASAVYVVAFQVGIGGGAFVGERFLQAGWLGALPVFTAVLAAVACAAVVAARRAFPLRISAADDDRAEAAREGADSLS